MRDQRVELAQALTGRRVRRDLPGRLEQLIAQRLEAIGSGARAAQVSDAGVERYAIHPRGKTPRFVVARERAPELAADFLHQVVPIVRVAFVHASHVKSDLTMLFQQRLEAPLDDGGLNGHLLRVFAFLCW